MQIFNYTIDKINIDNDIVNALNISTDDINKIMFIDIETTGLSPKNASIYLIGCGYYINNSLEITLFFADTRDDEKLIISEYINLINKHPYLIHFNGNKFDLPFIKNRALKYNIIVPEYEQSIDLYKFIKPYKNILSLPNLRLKTIEEFLKIKRNDIYSGGELINVYKQYEKLYLSNKYDDTLSTKLELLLLHNYEDVLNMDKILPIAKLKCLDYINLSFESMEINAFNTFDNIKMHELLIKCSGNFSYLPTDLNMKKNNGIYIKISKSGKALIRIPVITDDMKYFIEDYKNYYYLSDENMCVHKNACFGIDKNKRINATKENCFVTVSGAKIPCVDSCELKLRILKNNYNEKEAFILLSEFENLDSDSKAMILNEYIYGFS